ncbi:MAG: hypothetical protein WCO52_04320 [bacterium]
MSIKRWLATAVLSLIGGAWLSNALSQAEWTYQKGIYLSSGWPGGYSRNPGLGFPFTTGNNPPARCFCAIDHNSIADLLNAIFYIALVFIVITVIQIAWTSLRKTITVRQ